MANLNHSDHAAMTRGDRMRYGKRFACPRDRRLTSAGTCAVRFADPESKCHRADTPCALGQLVMTTGAAQGVAG